MDLRMFFWALSLLLVSTSFGFGQGSFKADDLVCEYQTNPIGIDVLKPRLSWKILSEERGWLQGAYQLQVARNADDLRSETGLVWDSGKVLSDASIHRSTRDLRFARASATPGASGFGTKAAGRRPGAILLFGRWAFSIPPIGR